MNQLEKIPLYMQEVHSLTNDEADENGLLLVLGNDLNGPPLLQFFPTSAIWTNLADALWTQENALQLKIGKFRLDDEILGGRATIEHTTLGGKPLNYEGVNLKAITLEPLPGRVMRVRCKAHLPDDVDAQTLHELLRCELTFTMRWAATEGEKAKDAGQMEMGLPTGADDAAEKDRQASLDAAAGLSPDAAKIVEQLRKDEAEENAQSASEAAPTEGRPETMPPDPFGPNSGSLVPGQKPPQRPKRSGGKALPLQ